MDEKNLAVKETLPQEYVARYKELTARRREILMRPDVNSECVRELEDLEKEIAVLRVHVAAALAAREAANWKDLVNVARKARRA